MSFCLPFSKNSKKKTNIESTIQEEEHTTETKVPQNKLSNKTAVSQAYRDRHEVKKWTFPPELEERLLKNIKNIPLANLDKPLCQMLCSHDPVTIDSGSPLYNPLKETDLRTFLPFLAGRTVSTYPENVTPPQDGIEYLHSYNDPLGGSTVSRQGDPIADKFAIRAFENGFAFCLADGCGWGPESRDAAQNAVNSFMEEIQRLGGARLGKKSRRDTASGVKDMQEEDEKDSVYISQGMIRAFEVAHNTITSGKTTSFTVGTTTCLAGVIMRALEGEEWRMITVGVGDCRAYHLTYHNSKNGIPIIRDATPERLYSDDEVKNKEAKEAGKARYMNFSDCGGRIGPLLEGCAPDLRNCAIGVCDLREGDIVIIMSDGVYDNFDPQHFGITPDALGIDLVMTGLQDSTTSLGSSKELQNSGKLQTSGKLQNSGKDKKGSSTGSSMGSSSQLSHRSSVAQPILAGKDWEKVLDWQAVDKIKKNYMTDLIRDLLLDTTPPGKPNVNFHPLNEPRSSSPRKSGNNKTTTPRTNLQPGEMIGSKKVVETMLRHCTLVTESSRKWMEQNPLQRQPRDYTLFPGKLDHSTCLAIHLAHNLPMPPQLSTSDPEILINNGDHNQSKRGNRSNSEGSFDYTVVGKNNGSGSRKIQLIPTGINKTNRKAIQVVIKQLKSSKATGLSQTLSQPLKIHWKQPDSTQQTMFNVLFSNTTHLLVDRMTANSKPKRTYKIMRGIAEGKWILYWDWLEACLKEKQWVNESDFEARDIYPGCVLGRERRESGKPGVFHGMNIRVGPHTMLEKGEGRGGVWQELIEMMGGTIVRDEDKKAGKKEDETLEEYWIMGEGEEGVKGKDGKWAAKGGGKDVEYIQDNGTARKKKWRVKEGWLLDCVYFYDIVNPESYFIDQGDVEMYRSRGVKKAEEQKKKEKEKEKANEESETSESTEQRDDEESERDDFY